MVRTGREDERFGKFFLAEQPDSCSSHLWGGWPPGSQDSRRSPRGRLEEARTSPVQKRDAVFKTKRCPESQDSSGNFQSTHDFHNFLRVKGALRMENRWGLENTKQEASESSGQDLDRALRRGSALCSTGDRRGESELWLEIT